MPRAEEEQARRFYRDLLEMEEVDKPPVLAARGGAWFRHGDLELHLGVEDGFEPAKKAHPGIIVEDLDRLAERLADAEIEVRPDDAFPGHRRFYVDDCFGNRLEFLQPAPDDNAPVLETPRLSLRPYVTSDIDAVFGYANDETFARFVPTVPWPYTREDAAAFVHLATTADPKVNPMFGIEHDGRLIGGCGLTIDPDAATAGMGYALRRDWRGKGLATEAAGRLLQYAFEDLNVALAWAYVDARNAASARVLEKIGMQYEGTLRGRRLHHGERRDDQHYSITREEWLAAAT